MKKILAFALACVMLLGCVAAISSCAKEETIVVGYTIYEPMNYKDENGELTGFDTDLAKAVFEKLGYNVIFKEIEWDKKYFELDAGTIDCIWNGFTANTADSDGVARSEKVDFSYNYMLNKQVVVTTNELAATVTGFDSFAGKVGAIEKGSAGETYLEKMTGSVKKDAATQLEALQQLSLGTADFIIVDEQLATSYVGKGDYTGLTVVTSLSSDPEYYAIGFKKGSELTAKVNQTLEELAADGTIGEIAKKYPKVTVNAITDFSNQK